MTASEIVANLDSFPPVSPAGLKLINLLNQTDQENEEITDTLKYDPVLTAKVLRMCNSSAYGFKQEITSVDQAVLMLGYDKVKRMVLALSFGTAMTTTLDAYAFEAKELWRHSFVTATVAENLTQDGLFNNLDPSTAFTTGLLHDIGKLVFNKVLSSELISSLRFEIDAHGLSRIEAEKLIIGTDHAEVGACLLEAWKLSPDIIEGVANHHRPLFVSEPRFSAVTCIANSVAHLSGSAPGWQAYAEKIDSNLVEALQITPDMVEMLIIDARDSAERIEGYMAIG